MKPHEAHRAIGRRRLRVRIVTVSTSRYAKMRKGDIFSDQSGDAAEKETLRAGHFVTSRGLLSDNARLLRGEVKRFLSARDDVLILAGGTGISPRDVTVETVRPFFDKEMDGFGELFRKLSYDEVGSAAMLTRATAGVARGKLIVCLPGSPWAVQTALKAFIGEFPHAVYVARG